MHKLQITYEQLLETIQEGIWVYDTDSNTTFVNPKMAEFLGYEAEEMTGKPIYDFFNQGVIKNIEQRVESRKSGISETYEEKLKHKEGHDVYVEIKVTPIIDDEGNFNGGIAGVTDITERKKAEEALRVSEKKLSGILNNMTDAVWSITWPDLRHIYHSPSLEKLYGRPAQEFYDNPTLFKEITHPEDQHLTEKAIEQLLKEGQATRECRVVKTDGSIIWINDRSKLIYDENHQPIRVEGVAQNITARKQAEEALRESEHRFNLAINGTGAGLWDWDMVNDTVFFSERWKAMLGYAEHEVENAFSGWQKLWHPDDVEKIEKSVQDHLNGKNEKYEIEHRVRHKDGSWRNILTRGDLIKDEQGKPVRWVGTNIDLTHIKKLEEKQRASEAKYRDLIENMSEIVYTLDEAAKISYVSHSIEPILGYKPEELINKTFAEINIIHPDDLAERFENFHKVMAGGKATSDFRLTDRAGQVVWVKTSAHPIIRDDKVIGLQGMLIDITERKKAEEALAKSLTFEKMVSRISTKFVNLPPEQIDEGINYTLKSVGEFFEVDRSYLYRFNENGETYSVTHIWCRDGVDGHFEKDQDFPVELTPWWVNELKNGRLVKIVDVSQMPDQLALDRADFLSEEIKSIFTMPLTLEGRVFGCFGFDTVFEHRVWTEEQVALLQVVAELITGAIARYDADRQIRVLSFHDQLTGLYNRRYFEHEMERLDQSREHPIAVISADLDGLKLINDTIGHNEGDRYLQAGAEVLKNSMRSSDILARVGGDEFALLMPRTDRAAAELLVNRIRRKIGEYCIEQQGLPLSISLGLAISESADYALEETYRMADNNMYTDKLQQGKKARAEIVSSLLSSLFERGNLAEGERDQVQELAIRLGQALKLPEDHLARLALFTQVYDLGKVGLPDSIIHSGMQNNTGNLTDAEREALHRHPEGGYRIASSSPDLTDVAELILKHHENYDGSGYPLGLKNDAIPVECRVLSIVVAYSAMTNPRPYAKTLNHKEALAELKRCAGSQFDPDLVATFINIVL